MSVRRISVEAIIKRLTSEVNRTLAPIAAFDADGTLWSGDVSDDVFLHCVQRDLLRDEARSALVALAKRFSVSHSSSSSCSEIAGALFAAYRQGRVAEEPTYAMMAWCYAGFAETELRDLTEEVLEHLKWNARINARLLPVIDWLGAHNVPGWIVSASPMPILEVAATKLGFARSSLVGTTATMVNGKFGCELLGSVPYGKSKVVKLRERVGSAALVAAFGDSLFDLELLTAATFGVAVDPKPELLSAIADCPTVEHLA